MNAITIRFTILAQNTECREMLHQLLTVIIELDLNYIPITVKEDNAKFISMI